MILAVLAASMVLKPAVFNVLFLGNSHTAYNDVPAMVKNLIESDGTGKRVATKFRMAGFVEELAKDADLRRDIQSGRFQAVVLQGAKLSSSHRYEYDHSGAVDLAKLAKKNRMAVWLFAEWPRRGWDETDYILKEYREISGPSGAKIVPICRVWDRLRADGFKHDLWSTDGNHASPVGSFVAACSIAAHLSRSPQPPKWKPTFVDAKSAAQIQKAARSIVDKG